MSNSLDSDQARQYVGPDLVLGAQKNHLIETSQNICFG